MGIKMFISKTSLQLIIFLIIFLPATLVFGEEALYEFWTKDGVGYINRQGEIVIQPQKNMNGEFSEGFVRYFDEEGKVGFADRNGNVVIEPKYVAANSFFEGRAIVRSVTEGGWKFGVIDKDGNEIVKPQYNIAEDYSEGLALMTKWITDENNMYVESYHYFIDKQGGIVLKFEYDYEPGYSPRKPTRFSNGYTCYGGNAIDRDGQEREDLLVNGKCYVFTEGLARVGPSAVKTGFINMEGELVVEKKFWMLGGEGEFSDGLIAFKIYDRENRNHKSKRGYIDKKGNIVIEQKFDRAEPFKNGLARVNFSAYIDKTGHVIWELKESSSLRAE